MDVVQLLKQQSDEIHRDIYDRQVLLQDVQYRFWYIIAPKEINLWRVVCFAFRRYQATPTFTII